MKLIEVILSKTENPSDDIETLFHVPFDFTNEAAVALQLPLKLKADELYLCTSSKADDEKIKIKISGALPQRHHLRKELLLILVGKTHCALISAMRGNNAPGDKSGSPLWKTIISFIDSEVLSGVRIANRNLENHLSNNKATVKWLKNAARRLSESNPARTGITLWNDYLPDFVIDIEKRRQESEGQLKWVKLLNRIQDAVGWELDTSKLFSAISHVLKTAIGFQYLEIQIIEGRGKKFDVTAVHHRNDTTFGGQLLTVILRPGQRLEILKGRKPILVNADNVNEILMNPRLMNYMGFQSGVIVPLIYQKKPNGLLKLFARQDNHFTVDDLPGMEAIGRVLARSIENMKVHTLMKRMATMDSLTSLFNRRFFAEQLTREFKRAQRYDSSLTLIMIDIDFFKNYNDAFGHLRGDQVLVTVSDLLVKCVREVDIVARYGGEEFAVILPEASLERGLIVAEKIRQTIEEYPFKFGDRQPSGRLTLSLGIASNTADLDNINEFINRADVALYRAKKTGRNKCEAFR